MYIVLSGLLVLIRDMSWSYFSSNNSSSVFLAESLPPTEIIMFWNAVRSYMPISFVISLIVAPLLACLCVPRISPFVLMGCSIEDPISSVFSAWCWRVSDRIFCVVRWYLFLLYEPFEGCVGLTGTLLVIRTGTCCWRRSSCVSWCRRGLSRALGSRRWLSCASGCLWELSRTLCCRRGLSGVSDCRKVLSRISWCWKGLSRVSGCRRVLSRLSDCRRGLSRVSDCRRGLSRVSDCRRGLSRVSGCWRVFSRPLIAQDKLFHRQNAVRNFLIPSTWPAYPVHMTCLSHPRDLK